MSDHNLRTAQLVFVAGHEACRSSAGSFRWYLPLLTLAMLAGCAHAPSSASDSDAAGPASRQAPVAASNQGTAATADREAAPIADSQMEHPATAAHIQEEGTVILRVSVDARGMPTDVAIARSSGSPDLDRAAMDAARTWRYNPAVRNGRQVAGVVEVPVDFKH